MRHPDWEGRLSRWATQANGLPFKWGHTDCVMLCLEAYDALAGTGLAEIYRGKWHSRSSALRFQRSFDFRLARVLPELGCVPVKAGYQQRGDFIIVEREPFPHGHVCFGEKAISSAIKGAVTWGRFNYGVPDGLHILRVP